MKMDENPYEAVVVNRDDPKGLHRITVRIEGLMAESAWALPQGAGAKNFGRSMVPPVGAIVLVDFIRHNSEHPTYRPGWIVRPDGESTAPREVEGSPDVAYDAFGPFRYIRDVRDGRQTASMIMVKEVNGEEQNIAEFIFDADHNTVRIAASTALKLESLGIIDVDAAQVQICGRTVVKNGRPIS